MKKNQKSDSSLEMKRASRKQHLEEDTSADKKEPIPLWKEVIFLISKVFFICLFFLLMFTFVFGLYRVDEAAMFPAVKDGDLVVFYRLNKTYQSGDLLVVKVEGKKQVRRVVAVGGDEVDITKDGLTINGYPQHGLEASYVTERTERYEEGIDFPLKVAEGEVFVLGDSREHSTDSRIYGAIQTEDTLGQLMLLLRRRNF